MDTDHGKGLIISSSSSSSSTLPTRRPHRVGSKPLPDKLRKQIEDSHGVAWYGVVRYCCYAHLIEPIECIDPDDPKSWAHLDDPSNLIRGNDIDNPIKKYLFTPNQCPLVQGKKIVGRPIFELYRIEILKLDPERDFSSIYMMGTNTDYQPIIIYNLPESEEIPIPPLNQPLPLKNIFRPPSALDDVTIALSNPANGGWALWYDPPYPEDRKTMMKYGRRREYVTDELTESAAFISYELIESAAIAELVFTFLDDKERLVTILSGSITATTNGDPFTERIIQQFSSSKPSVLQTNVPVPVDRSVFGVSLGKSLHIHVNLDFDVGREGTKAPGIPGFVMVGDYKIISTTTEFPAPCETMLVESNITPVTTPVTPVKSESIKMRMKVSWWDFMV